MDKLKMMGESRTLQVGWEQVESRKETFLGRLPAVIHHQPPGLLLEYLSLDTQPK